MNRSLHHIFHHLFLPVCAVVLCCLALHARADSPAVEPLPTPATQMKLVSVGTVISVPRPNKIVLDDKKTYLLANIRIPVYYSEAAQKYLIKTLVGRKVGIYIDPSKTVAMTDRFGDIPCHVMTEDAVWIQGDLVGRGMAWAYSTPAETAMIKTLYVYEKMARDESKGFWANPAYAVKDASNIASTIGSFQLYQGVVESVHSIKGLLYIRFSENNNDLTLTISRDIYSGQTWPWTLDSLRNRQILVHGWVEDNGGGPVVEITHPAQIELLKNTPKHEDKAVAK